MTQDRTYADFDLLIEAGADEGYRARVVDSPAGRAAGSFELPFSEMQLENFMLKVGRPRRGVRRLESPEMEAARQFGTQLFDAVFRDDLKLSLRRSLDEVERRDEGLRIRLWFSGTPELASLPWEFLFSEADDQFLVLSAWTPIVRYLDLTHAIEPLTVTGPLRILVMISSPHDYPELDVEEEWARIESALGPLVERGAVVIDRTDNATLLEVQRLLRRNDYHIFHFVGHGGFDEKANDGVLVLEDGNNRSRLVAGRDVGTILSDHRSLRLAVLNSCEGGRAGEEDPFSGAAQSLVRKGIPGVVAMQFEITDDAAIAFAQEFYGAIADGYPVDAAIGESRRAIFGQGNDIEWGTPVVYLRGDGRLFEVVPAEGAPTVVAAAAATEAIEAGSKIEVIPETEEPTVEVVKPEPEPEPEVDEAVVPPVPPEPEPEVDEAVVGAAAVAAAATIDEAVEPPVPPEPEPDEDELPPADRPSLNAMLFALPMWLLWSLIAVGALLVVVLAVIVFSPDDTTAGGEETAPVQETETTATATTDATGTTAAATTVAAALTPNGEELIVPRSVADKVLDGIYGEDWPERATFEFEHVFFVHDDIRDRTVARAGTSNAGFVSLAWDDTYLYLFALIDDDVLSAPNTGERIVRNDAVNLNISVLEADGGVSQTADDDDHGLTLSPGDPAAGTGPDSAHYIVGGKTISTGYADMFADSGGGFGQYSIEARIKWSEIGVTPHAGDQFGLLLTVFDNDGEFNGDWLQAEIMAHTPPSGEPLDNRWFRSPVAWGLLTLEG